MKDKDIGELIKKTRGKALTLEALGKKIETSKTALSAIENGKRSVCVNTLRKIADALGYDLIINFKRKKVK